MKLKEVSPANAYRLFYPSNTALLSVSFQGKDDVIPVISFCSLSFDPPLFGVAINRKHFSHGLVKKSGCFALNLLDASKAKAIAAAGDVSSRVVKNKLSAVGLALQRARQIDGKAVKDAVAVVECKVIKVIQTGDYDFFVGRCEAAYAAEDFDEYWRFEKYSPSLYIGSKGTKKRKHVFALLNRKFSEVPYLSKSK